MSVPAANDVVHPPDLQHFLQWLERNTVPAYQIDTASDQSIRGFIPHSTVERYFRADRYANASKVLRAAFGAQHVRDLPVRPTEVAEHCARIFCILVSIGKAKHISAFVKDPLLFDDHLPFHTPPYGFPTQDDFFGQFYQRQWRFCAPKLKPHRDLDIHSDYILPIVQLETRSTLGSSSVYKVKIHEEYDGLLQRTNLDTSTHTKSIDTGRTHGYAVKTFRQIDARNFYEQEIQAFRHLTDIGTQNLPGMVQTFLGFRYKDTFNIILEYADQGDLESYWQSNPPPSTAESVIDFWVKLFDLIKAVAAVHQRQHVYAEESKNLLGGWHLDIKPKNIVLASTETGTSDRCHFKLCDLGLSYFATTSKDNSGNFAGCLPALSRATLGLRTYGAPECYCSYQFSASSHSHVGHKVDIWSLGCVYSEAAIWMTHGYEGLQGYRNDRREYLREKSELSDYSLFHDGLEKLSVVKAWHLRCKQDADANHYITGAIIDAMIEEMLQGSHLHRPSASTLDAKAQRIVAQARKALGQGCRQRTSNPELSSARSTRITAIKGATKRSGSSIPSTPDMAYNDQQSSSSSSCSFDWTVTTRDTISTIASSRSSMSELVQVTTDTTTIDMSGAMSPDADADCSQVPHCADSEIFEDQKSSVRAKTDANLSQASLPTILSSVAMPAPVPFDNESLPVSIHSHGSHQSLEDKSSHSHCTRTAALTWYQCRKMGDLSAHLPGEEMLEKLRNRNHIFLVDDSKYMENSWHEVVELVRLLAYVTKQVDRDGIDLRFLSDGTHCRSRRSTKLAGLVGHRKPQGSHSLSKELESCLEQQNDPASKVRGRFGRSSRMRPRNVCVFTGGILPTDDRDSCERLINQLAEIPSPCRQRDQFSIQFIKFGTSRKGLEFLQRLSNLESVTKSSCHIDVVDAVDGNIWKMLSGTSLASDAAISNDDAAADSCIRVDNSLSETLPCLPPLAGALPAEMSVSKDKLAAPPACKEQDTTEEQHNREKPHSRASQRPNHLTTRSVAREDDEKADVDDSRTHHLSSPSSSLDSDLNTEDDGMLLYEIEEYLQRAELEIESPAEFDATFTDDDKSAANDSSTSDDTVDLSFLECSDAHQGLSRYKGVANSCAIYADHESSASGLMSAATNGRRARQPAGKGRVTSSANDLGAGSDPMLSIGTIEEDEEQGKEQVPCVLHGCQGTDPHPSQMINRRSLDQHARILEQGSAEVNNVNQAALYVCGSCYEVFPSAQLKAAHSACAKHCILPDCPRNRREARTCSAPSILTLRHQADADCPTDKGRAKDRWRYLYSLCYPQAENVLYPDFPTVKVPHVFNENSPDRPRRVTSRDKRHHEILLRRSHASIAARDKEIARLKLENATAHFEIRRFGDLLALVEEAVGDKLKPKLRKQVAQAVADFEKKIDCSSSGSSGLVVQPLSLVPSVDGSLPASDRGSSSSATSFLVQDSMAGANAASGINGDSSGMVVEQSEMAESEWFDNCDMDMDAFVDMNLPPRTQ